MTDSTFTALLERRDLDGSELVNELVPLVYDELKSIARHFLAGERHPKQTLDTTALVHEAYLKLADGLDLGGRGRAYFFGAVARAMRQVLVDAARRRGRLRRGAGEALLPLSAIEAVAEDRGAEVLAIDQSLSDFAALYPRQARVIECRFFGGLSVEETAEALSLSERTVKRDAAFAQAWLSRALKDRS